MWLLFPYWQISGRWWTYTYIRKMSFEYRLCLQKSSFHSVRKRVWEHPKKSSKVMPLNFVKCFQMVGYRIVDHTSNAFGRIRHLTILWKLNLGLVEHGTKHHKIITRIMTISLLGMFQVGMDSKVAWVGVLYQQWCWWEFSNVGGPI